jgi:hypothetical protein
MATASLVYEAPTRLQGTSLTLRPGQFATFPGAKIGSHRKRIIITNEDVNTRVYIVAGPDQGKDPATQTVKLLTLKTDASIELDTNGTVTLKNISASEIVTPVQVLELFYDERAT